MPEQSQRTDKISVTLGGGEELLNTVTIMQYL